jgi:hypothetical protein
MKTATINPPSSHDQKLGSKCIFLWNFTKEKVTAK